MEGNSADRSAPARHKQRDFNVGKNSFLFPMPRTWGGRPRDRNPHNNALYAIVRGFDTNERTSRNRLHNAVGSYSYDAVQRFLENKADVNATDDFGNTPLHEAVKIDSKEIVLLLIRYGAKVNATNNYGDTPLHEAAKEGSEDIISILIDQGAGVNATNRYGKTPLHKAARTGSEESIFKLIDQGAYVNATDRYGRTPLHYAIARNSHDLKGIGAQFDPRFEVLLGHKTVRVFITQKAIVDAVDINGRTPLHFAVEARSVEAVGELVRSGANIALRDKYGRTPVYNASRLILGKLEVLSALGVTLSAKFTRFLWEPPDAFNLSTNAEEALKALTNSISLIRQEDHVVATTLGAFVLDKFGKWGLKFLYCIASAFTARDRTHGKLEEIKVI